MNRGDIVTYHLSKLRECIEYEFGGCEYDPIFKHLDVVEGFIEDIVAIAAFIPTEEEDE